MKQTKQITNLIFNLQVLQEEKLLTFDKQDELFWNDIKLT